MKTPLVIVIAVVVGILGFLVFYSQQHEMTTQAHQGVAVEATAPDAAGHASGEK